MRPGARQKDFPLAMPAILGKDVSGVCSRPVGSEVRNVKPGERVLAMADATYAQYVAVPDALVTHLPGRRRSHRDAAAIPLVVLTGEQLVRLATQVTSGQTILVSGALGSVGRAAVHAAKKLGAKVIAGVRGRQLAEAESLGVWQVTRDRRCPRIANLAAVDGVADTVGGGRRRQNCSARAGGRFGYAAFLPEGAAANHPSVTVTRVFARPDPSKVREFADDVRDGKFICRSANACH